VIGVSSILRSTFVRDGDVQALAASLGVAEAATGAEATMAVRLKRRTASM
jgi:hypothetical protein